MLLIPVNPDLITYAALRRRSVSKCVKVIFTEYLRDPVPLPEPVTKGAARKVYVGEGLFLLLQEEARRQGMPVSQLARRVIDHARPAHWAEELAAAGDSGVDAAQHVPVPVRLGGEFTPERLRAGLVLLESVTFSMRDVCPKEDVFMTTVKMPLAHAHWYRTHFIPGYVITTAALELALAQEQRTPACASPEST